MVHKALILAAGMGTRLKELTEDIPKALIEVNGKPMMEYQLEALQKNGIKDIIIVTGYKANKIEEFVKQEKFKGFNFTLLNNDMYEDSNSSYSFWRAKDHIKEGYIHLNCDTLFDSELIKEVLESKYDNTIVLNYKTKLATKHCEQVLMDGDKITKMDSTGYPGSVAKAIGIAKLSPGAVRWITNQLNYYLNVKKDKKLPFYKLIRQAIWHLDFYGLDSKNHKICDINTQEQLEEAEKMMSND